MTAAANDEELTRVALQVDECSSKESGPTTQCHWVHREGAAMAVRGRTGQSPPPLQGD